MPDPYTGFVMGEMDHHELLRELISSSENHCFVCSLHNPIGLRLRFTEQDGVVRADFVPGEWHVGWAGVVHGGILASVLDEAMAYCLFFAGFKAVTAKMEIRYRAPIRHDDRLHVEAVVTRDTRRLADVEGRIFRDGRLVVDASACFMKLGRLDLDTLGSPLSIQEKRQSPDHQPDDRASVGQSEEDRTVEA